MILTGFQLRAARRALNLHLEQLYQNTGVSKITLSRLENTIGNLEDISCSAKDAEILLNYFNQNKLIFPNKKTIVLDVDIEPKPVENNLIRFQFIVARTVLGLFQRELTIHLNLHPNTFYRFEKKGNTSYIVSRKKAISVLINFFNTQGIYFPNNSSVSLKNNLTLI